MAWQNKPSLVISRMGAQPNLPPSSQIWGLPKSALPLPRGSGAATLDSREQLCHSSSCHPFPSHILGPGNSGNSDRKPRRLRLEIKSRWFVFFFSFSFCSFGWRSCLFRAPSPRTGRQFMFIHVTQKYVTNHAPGLTLPGCEGCLSSPVALQRLGGVSGSTGGVGAGEGGLLGGDSSVLMPRALENTTCPLGP